MNRQDAEDAMEACNEADPFRVGRQLMLRWGKNVRKVDGGVPIVRKGTGGVASVAANIRTDAENLKAAAALEATLNVDRSQTIQVVPPSDRRRFHYISTVASFVANDGDQFEQMLSFHESGNADFQFLAYDPDAAQERKKECVFYRWRVYSLCQGDSFNIWRTEPFKMLAPHGCTWIPPPLDSEAARQEAEEAKRKEVEMHLQKQKRKLQSTQRIFSTGRQLEQAQRRGGDAGAKLTELEQEEFNRFFREQLSLSRASICEAMSFCFEKSGAAKEVSSLLQELLLHITPGTSIETLTARVFLLSDILYNSQQPGIRNAFLYRDAVEQMSPKVFKTLGEYARGSLGRLSGSRLATSINAVFAAWVNWGVFDPVFMDELQARFEGREIVIKVTDNVFDEAVDPTVDTPIADDHVEASISNKSRGDWTTVSAADSQVDTDASNAFAKPAAGSHGVDVRVDVPNNADGNKQFAATLPDDDADGEPLEDDPDQAVQLEAEDADGEPIDDDPDGEPIDDDADGEPIDDDPDGEPIDDDPDGEPLTVNPDDFGGDPDGEPLDEDPAPSS
jgi:U2-associated protein SR140